jgi:hypothetical protein
VHSLRRTYISIALLVNNFEVNWVHGSGRPRGLKDDDGRARNWEQRVVRSHGTNFDPLLRLAREQSNGDGWGLPSLALLTARLPRSGLAAGERKRRHGEGRNRTGDTTIFSRVLYQLSYLAVAIAS